MQAEAGTGAFAVDYDRHENVLCISIAGFLTPQDVPAVAMAIDAGARDAYAIRPDFDVIVESFDFPVQANDVADMLTAIMQRGMALTSGRAAIVVGSLLNKLQATRTLAHPRVQVFEAMDEAQAWLAEKPQ